MVAFPRLQGPAPCPYTGSMVQTRLATFEDAPIIAQHRHRMFVDAGRADNRSLRRVTDAFETWVVPMMREGKYMGWLALSKDRIVGGAGLMIMDWPPHPLDPGPQRGYLLNVYVEPEFRRKRIASNLIELALAEARRRKIRVVSLHATDESRRMYESSGFRRTNEMFYVESVEG
ncbi:MAG: GNAT family N-acetyltransferase [Acidobacteriaceae bacterium]